MWSAHTNSRHFIARSSDFGAVLIYYCKIPLLTYAFYYLKHKALWILLFGRERSWRNNWIKQGIKKKSWSHCADHSRQRESRIKLGATAVIQSQPDYYRSSTWLLSILYLIIIDPCFNLIVNFGILFQILLCFVSALVSYWGDSQWSNVTNPLWVVCFFREIVIFSFLGTKKVVLVIVLL
jgi:hypothetical protein